MFILHNLIQLAFKNKRKLFCAFIDLEQAFDSVCRSGIWHKLLQCHINGKCFNLIKNMYENIKSCVKVNGTCSNLFPCQIGLRQGENLSPVIFSLYLNDLYDFFNNSDLLNGTNLLLPNHTSNVIYDYLKIFLLLYADDTVLISDTAEDLQNALNLYERYCQE